VLPDEASGQGPGTPRQRGHKAVTVQGGYGALFAILVQNFVSITRVAVQGRLGAGLLSGIQVFQKLHWRSVAPKALTEAKLASGLQRFYGRATARVRVQEPLQICLRCRSKSKKCDNTTYLY